LSLPEFDPQTIQSVDNLKHSGHYEIGGACSAYGGGECLVRVLVVKPEGDNLGDPGVDGRIILR